MKINELVMNIHNKDFDLEDALRVKKYLPIEVKKVIAQGIIYECVSEELGVVKVDSVQRYLSYVEHMIKSHTCLEYMEDDYDVLCSTEYNSTTLLNAIMECFGEDAKECSRILNLMMDDYMQDYSIEAVVARLVHHIEQTIDGFAKKAEGLDVASLFPENFDLDSINTFLEKYVK